MRKKETPNPSRVRGRGVEVSETLFYSLYDGAADKEKVKVEFVSAIKSLVQDLA